MHILKRVLELLALALLGGIALLSALIVGFVVLTVALDGFGTIEGDAACGPGSAPPFADSHWEWWPPQRTCDLSTFEFADKVRYSLLEALPFLITLVISSVLAHRTWRRSPFRSEDDVDFEDEVSA